MVNMRQLITLTAAIGLAFLLQLWLPWWSVALVGFLIGLAGSKSPKSALGLGFASVFLCWLGQTLWINYQNEGILASRMGLLLGGAPGYLLPWVSGRLGGLVGALSAWTGFLFKNLAFRK